MKQTAGKIYARDYFYESYLAEMIAPRRLRSSNVLTLLGEDFREIALLDKLGVPPYRVFSVEKDLEIYRRQQARNRSEDLGVSLFFGNLSDYVHTHLRHHDISIFNLDIFGSYLNAVDPVLSELLIHVRRNPYSVMATYSNAARDRPQLMEGLKSLVVLLWLAPDSIDKLVRYFYSQYRTTLSSGRESTIAEVSKNMLLRHMFWLRSHMEHVMASASALGLLPHQAVVSAMAEQEAVWKRFVAQSTLPLRYVDVLEFVERSPRPKMSDGTKLDLEFSDVDFITYTANDGFYHNCYFATFESASGAVGLSTWLAESSKSLRRHPLKIVGEDGVVKPSCYGQVAVDTDEVTLWHRGALEADLRRIALAASGQPMKLEEELAPQSGDSFDPATVTAIHELARMDTSLTGREIAARLSLTQSLPRIIAQVAVARRKK